MSQDWVRFDPFEENNWTRFDPFANQAPPNPDPYGFGSLQLTPAQMGQDDQFMGGGIQFPNTPWNEFIKPNQAPQPETEGFLRHLAAPILNPLWEGGSKAGRFVGDILRKVPDVPMTEIPSGFEDTQALANPNNLYATGAEFAGDLASGVTSPLNLGLGGLGVARSAGLNLAARNLSPGINAVALGGAQAANTGLKYGSIGVAGQGGYDLFHPESTLQERAFGAANLLGGAYGANVARRYDPKPIPEPIPANRLGKEAPTPYPNQAINLDDLDGVRPISETDIAVIRPNKETIQTLFDSGYKPSGKRTPEGYPIMVLSEDTVSLNIKDFSGDPNFQQNREFDLAGQSIMTSERVNQVYGMSVRDALEQRLIVPDGNGYRANVKFLNRNLDPNLDPAGDTNIQLETTPIEILLKGDITTLSDEDLIRIQHLDPNLGGTSERNTEATYELMRRGHPEGKFKSSTQPTFINANTGEMIDYDFDQGTRQSTQIPMAPSELPEGMPPVGTKINYEGQQVGTIEKIKGQLVHVTSHGITELTDSSGNITPDGRAFLEILNSGTFEIADPAGATSISGMPPDVKEKIGTRTVLNADQVQEVFGVPFYEAINRGWVVEQKVGGMDMYRPMIAEPDLNLQTPYTEDPDVDEDVFLPFPPPSEADIAKLPPAARARLELEKIAKEHGYNSEIYKKAEEELDYLINPVHEFEKSVEPTQSHTGGEFDFNEPEFTVPANNPLEQQLKDYVSILSNEELLAHHQNMQKMTQAGMELDESDMIETRLINEELKRRGIPALDQVFDGVQYDTLGDFDPNDDIMAAKQIDFEKPTVEKLQRELQTRNIPDDKRQQVQFLIDDGRLRQAMSILKEYPVKTVAEVHDDFFNMDTARRIPITESSKNILDEPPLRDYRIQRIVNASRGKLNDRDLNIALVRIEKAYNEGLEFDEEARKAVQLIEAEGVKRGLLPPEDVTDFTKPQSGPVDIDKILADERRSMSTYAADELEDFGLATDILRSAKKNNPDLFADPINPVEKRGVADFPPEMEGGLPKLRTPEGIKGETFAQFVARTMDGMTPERFNNLPGDIRNGAAQLYKESQDKLKNKSADVIPFNRERNLLDDEPSEMRVPGTDNIAMGGADERVLDVLGTSLYTRDRPSTVAKELLQNSVDERKISGINEPIRILFNEETRIPGKNTKGRSIVVKDFGRGMTRDQLYTIFSDVGKTGKLNEAGASGGFGFAKAAPFLSGEYMRVESITIENGRKVRHTFEGTPAQFKDQTKGVPIHTDPVYDPNIKTGFEVEVFFPEDKDFYDAKKLVTETVENSPELDNIETFENYFDDIRDPEYGRDFLNEGKAPQYYDNALKKLKGQPIPPKVETMSTPAVDMDIHYDFDDKERKGSKVVFLNNGLYVETDNWGAVREPGPHIPPKIVIDIKSKVAEGEDGYPFGANREAIDRNLLTDLRQWYKDKIGNIAEQRRLGELRQVFDDLKPRGPAVDWVVLDSGERYTSNELDEIYYSRTMRQIGNTMKELLDELDVLNKDITIGQTIKYGFLIGKEGRGGINVPRAGDRGKFAILVNPFGAVAHASTVEEYADRLVHIIKHEFVHNIARSEGAEFTWAFAKVDSRLGAKGTLRYVNRILAAIDNLQGDYVPEFKDLLQRYEESRRRSETKKDILSRERESEWIGEPDRPEGISGDDGKIGEGDPSDEVIRQFDEIWKEINTNNAEKVKAIQKAVPQEDIVKNIDQIIDTAQNKIDDSDNPEAKESIYRAAHDFVRTNLTAFDMSAPMRQGLGLITERGWWTSWDDMFKAFGSQEAFNMIQEAIKEDPSGLFRPRMIPVTRNGKVVTDRSTGLPKLVERKSWAEDAGLVLTDMVNNTEEQFRSKLAERVPITGRMVRASNRAFVSFLNKTRADTFKALVKQAVDDGKDPYTNKELMKQIANFVNIASGRGEMKVDVPRISIPGMKKPLIAHKEIEFEGATKALAEVFFAPRLMASRINTYMNVLNPHFYRTVDPMIRKRTLRSLLGIVGTGLVVGQMLNMAGDFLGYDSEMVTDPTNPDFMKGKIGSSRFDGFGGYQQYFVAAARFLTGQSTSSMSQRTTNLTSGDYGDPTRKDVGERLFANKLAPVPGLIWSWMENKNFDGTPFELKRNMMELTYPLLVQDLQELYEEDPTLIPLAVLPFFGVGIQTYGNR